MTKKYKIDFTHQFNSIKDGINIAFIGIFIFILLNIFFNDIGNVNSLLNIICMTFSLYILPALIIHFNYYYWNFNTQLIINNDIRTIEIKNNLNSKIYSFNEIHLTEKHIGIYYKNKVDFAFRRFAPWSNYGYIKLIMKNNDTFYFTSLMINFQEFPFKLTHTKYRFFPLIQTSQIKFENNRKKIERFNEEKINLYLKRFSNLSIDSLQNKINNASKYEPEAIIAAKKLLNSNL